MIEACVTNLLLTRLGEARFATLKGVDPQWIDQPGVAGALAVLDLSDMLELFEPRVDATVTAERIVAEGIASAQVSLTVGGVEDAS